MPNMTERCRNCGANATIELRMTPTGGPDTPLKSCPSCGLHGLIDLGL